MNGLEPTCSTKVRCDLNGLVAEPTDADDEHGSFACAVDLVTDLAQI
jgi:hypothetical protein